ncbi:hypothetical protein THOM_0264 [Trachipleistophora hominis]|uniref:Uncharacterized protein n=1 Tax=Trachipleistophora hominis TaxID=72359 RepID=L7JZ64_TRAHO|nr:hypothetical protein THOM_0264 [Trachipleistophora hominis]
MEDNFVVRKIIETQMWAVKDAFKRSIKNMYTYLNNYGSVEYLINMSEIFDDVDKLKDNLNDWINGFIIIYQKNLRTFKNSSTI